jgi:MoaA/NifB/PqqE/SkfB family radical SAM enzyme
MAATMTVSEAVDDGRMSGTVWLYTNYHCNLACSYCLTESAPKVDPRLLERDQVLATATQARDLGFRELGITGGEPFLLPWLPEVVAEVARLLPVTVLSNATLFSDALIDRLRPLGQLPVRVQISLDRPDAVENDEMRGPRNFQKVMEAIPKLVDIGIKVRIATTLGYDEIQHPDLEERERLCALHRRFGITDDDHVIRPIVARGRASVEGLGVTATRDDLAPELTLTADGAFWNPFAPTVVDGRVDTDLLLTRTIQPLETPASTMLRVVEGRPPGHDATLGIR